MANAKRCDICGEYFEIPEYGHEVMLYGMPAGAVRVYKMDPELKYGDDRKGTHFDSCDKCAQEIIDYILAKRAAADNSAE